jgi:hypothetical protein
MISFIVKIDWQNIVLFTEIIKIRIPTEAFSIFIVLYLMIKKSAAKL